MNVLVTGGLGFIGRNICRKLKSAGHRPIAATHSNKNINDQGDIAILDITRKKDFSALDRFQIDAIVHCAAIRGESGLSVNAYKEVNVLGCQNVIEYALSKNIRRFIYLSTVGVLGTIPSNQPASVDDAPAPDSNYHLSKWEAEEVVRHYQSDDFKTLILRPTITYGQSDDGFMHKLIRMISKNQFYYPSSEIKIHLLDVKSLAALIVTVVERDSFDNGVYMVADEKPIKLDDVVQLISISIKKRPYSNYHKLPISIFRFAESLIDIVKNKQLSTSLNLISRNWCYDISTTIDKLSYIPSDTKIELGIVLDNGYYGSLKR